MQINIRATNMELTPNLKNYTEKRLKGLDKFIDPGKPEISGFVEIGKITKHHREGNIFRAEIQLKHPDYRSDLRVETESQDLYAAIDEASEKIKRVLIQSKEKRKSFVKRGARLFKKIVYETIGKRFD